MLVMAVKVNGAERSYPKGSTFTVMASMLLGYTFNGASLIYTQWCPIFIDTFR